MKERQRKKGERERCVPKERVKKERKLYRQTERERDRENVRRVKEM